MTAKHGKIAYEAYHHSRGGISATGSPLVAWENLDEQDHWNAAAQAVTDHAEDLRGRRERRDAARAEEEDTEPETGGTTATTAHAGAAVGHAQAHASGRHHDAAAEQQRRAEEQANRPPQP